MSSPRSTASSVREGTRVVLREITASLHNSSTLQPLRNKTGNDSSPVKTAEHEVKVRFAREFADVGSITYSTPESLSSASSFQSLNSNLSTKSGNSNGVVIGADLVPHSPNPTANNSYVNPNISGVDDLILGCAEIHLNSEEDHQNQSSQDLSQDQTFTSATDELPVDDRFNDFSTESPNGTQIIGNDSSTTHESTSGNGSTSPSSLDHTQDIQDRPILLGTICIREPLPVALITNNRYNICSKGQGSTEKSISPNKSNNDLSSGSQKSSNPLDSVVETSLTCPRTKDSNLNSTVCLSLDKEILDVRNQEESVAPENTSVEAPSTLSLNVPSSVLNSVRSDCSSLTEHGELSLPSISTLAEHVEGLSLPSIPTLSSFTVTDSSGFSENDSQEDKNNVKSPLAKPSSPATDNVVAVIACPENVLNESPAGETQDRNSSSTEIVVSASLYDTANVGESCANHTNNTPTKARPRTSEVQQNSEETNDHRDADSIDIVVNKVELFLPKEDSLEINVSPIRKEEVEDKSNVSPNLKRSASFERIDLVHLTKENEEEENEVQSPEEKLDRTLTLQDVSLNGENVPDLERYIEFKPQRQSTSLDTLCIQQPNFDDLKSAAEQVADDIFKSSLEFTNESDCFVSATSELFQDPKCFDFLIAHGNSKKTTVNRLRTESLYVKFDPLVSDTSMLPQGNTQSVNEEQNGKNENAPTNISSPKCNPAIAAIDRLLYFSPISTRTVQKMEEPREKIEQSTDEPKSETPLITDINMSKELELVKATVLQLEEELEKRKKEYESELEKQKNSFQEKIHKLQTQLAQEVKSKSQMTVVVEEYEKSISRLLTEKERDRTNLEQEKAKLQEELQATNVHLTNTEAAFNDVHQKYERLKGVVSAYKSNETVLKESIEENMETIKGLETRYEQLKNHAMAQLEKANLELDAIRKQHEDETVKLHAMVRKAELKSNSLAELVEQKTKENKELTQILDEVIARVGHQNAE